MANNKYSCLSTPYIIYNTIEIPITNIIKHEKLLSDLNLFNIKLHHILINNNIITFDLRNKF